MKLSLPLMYAGNPREAADQVAALEKAGLDTVWVAEAYGFDSPTLMGYLAAKTETVEIGVGDPQHLLAHARRPAADRRRPRQRLRRPRDPRPRRLRPAGDRGLARPALRQAAGPHPRGRRPRAPRPAPRGARPTTGIINLPLPAGPGHRARQAAEDAHPARARQRPDLRSPRSARRTSSGRRGVRRRLAADPVRSRRRPARSGATRSPRAPPSAPTSSARCEIAAGGMVAIGEGRDQGLLDFARPMFALYIGGMGARGKNFYNDLACQYGYEKEAKEIQDLYLDGKKKEAEAAVPAELLEIVQPRRPRVVRQGADRGLPRGRRHQPPDHPGRRGPGRARRPDARSWIS